jgi:hypothetical protein
LTYILEIIKLHGSIAHWVLPLGCLDFITFDVDAFHGKWVPSKWTMSNLSFVWIDTTLFTSFMGINILDVGTKCVRG